MQQGGPAAAAGFRDGDVVVAVADAPVTELSPSGVHILIGNRAPGTSVSVTVTRGAAKVTGNLVLGENEQR